MHDHTVLPGDIYQLGRHRLMCGDATNKADVAALFGDDKPTLVVTSPPYAKQRNYDRPIACWDTMMLGALNGHALADDVQILVNLGAVHHKGEWIPYWNHWLAMARKLGWRIFGQYVWDKIVPAFGQNQGRCRTSHEYIFHINRVAIALNEIVLNKYAGVKTGGKNFREKNGSARRLCSPGHVKLMRPQDSIFRAHPAKGNRTSHPAVYPIALVERIIASWKKKDCTTYDPFCGSGTTIHAAEQEGVLGLGMEIAPAYVQIALDRWNKAYPDQAAINLTRPGAQPQPPAKPRQLVFGQP